MSRRNVRWFHFWNPNSGWRGGLLASSVSVHHVSVQAYKVQDPALAALGNQLNNSGAV